VIRIIVAALLFGLVVLICELLWRFKVIRGEYSRKLVHVVTGIMLAFIPYFLSWHEVEFVGLISGLFILLARNTDLIKSWYDIDRNSWGEFIGPTTFLVIAFFQPARILFTVVVLHVALADGFAAVLGKRFGKNNQYKVFGYTKSVVGTATFVATSLAIMIVTAMFGNLSSGVPALGLLVIPLVTAVVENFSVFGVDNALISITVVGLFALFKIS
jgi:phytol kinase